MPRHMGEIDLPVLSGDRSPHLAEDHPGLQSTLRQDAMDSLLSNDLAYCSWGMVWSVCVVGWGTSMPSALLRHTESKGPEV